MQNGMLFYAVENPVDVKIAGCIFLNIYYEWNFIIVLCLIIATMSWSDYVALR